MVDYVIVKKRIEDGYRNGVSLDTIFNKVILAIKKPRYDLIIGGLIEVSSAEAVAKMLLDGCYYTALKNVVALLCEQGVDVNWILNNLNRNLIVPEGVILALLKNGADKSGLLDLMDDLMIQRNIDKLSAAGIQAEDIVSRVKKLDLFGGGTFIEKVKEYHGSIDALARNVALEDLLRWYKAFDVAGLSNGILISKFYQAEITESCYSLVSKNHDLIQIAIDDCGRLDMKRNCQHKLDCTITIYNNIKSI